MVVTTRFASIKSCHTGAIVKVTRHLALYSVPYYNIVFCLPDINLVIFLLPHVIIILIHYKIPFIVGLLYAMPSASMSFFYPRLQTTTCCLMWLRSLTIWRLVYRKVMTYRGTLQLSLITPSSNWTLVWCQSL